jgi:hypothetical protein
MKYVGMMFDFVCMCVREMVDMFFDFDFSRRERDGVPMVVVRRHWKDFRLTWLRNKNVKNIRFVFVPMGQAL